MKIYMVIIEQNCGADADVDSLHSNEQLAIDRINELKKRWPRLSYEIQERELDHEF